MAHILAIDQGTTSSRAIIFGPDMNPVEMAQEEFTQHFPKSGWVEHDVSDLWSTTIRTCRKAIKQAGLSGKEIAGIGITNQRETTIVWDKKTGKPIHRAIVWQDRRTSKICQDLRNAGYESMVISQTGLLLDPYFSATKLKWLLDNVDGARARAENGDLLFGTVDSFLIWNLTGGEVHSTDATNASRTLLYNIHKGVWSKDICALLDIPAEMLPEVKDCAANFGHTKSDLFGSPLPILGAAGDQQAATVGQACFEPGMLKSTYGTGCFALLNTGKSPVKSKNRMLTTIAYQLDSMPIYALEGAIFIAGAVVQWLRDGLGIIESASQSQSLAIKADKTQDLILVPAFTGLGAPYWDADCRGAVYGLARNSGPAEFTKAALESVGYQTRDLLEAMYADWPDGTRESVLRVDGGLTANDWAMQFLSNILQATVDRPKVLETTALGAAWLAGMRAGVYPGQSEFSKNWALERRFCPDMRSSQSKLKYARWKKAVSATLSV